MNTTQAPVIPLELRVLDGEQCGASVGVQRGVPLTISGQWHSDVVLRSPMAAQAEVELLLGDDAVEVFVKQGSVQVGGAPVPAGTRARAKLYAPIVIGDTQVALGELGASPWGTLFQPAPEAAATASETAAATLPWWQRLHERASPQRLVVGGGVLAVVSLAMLTLAMLVAPQAPSAEQRAQRAQQLLHAAGFTALRVTTGPKDELIAGGYLNTQAERVQAQRVLEADDLKLQWSPWINEQLAGAVEDVYRVNGVAAQVQAIGPGALRVTTQMADAAALQRAEATARRDVQGLLRLEARNAPPPREPSPIPLVDDPGKRVASIVGGPTPHVVTADGARYFIGALLPTGHRIQAIDSNSVQLEREGQISTLSF